MARSATPAPLLTHIIHAPDRGNAASVPEDKPTTTSRAVIPSENTNRYTNPSTPLRVFATQVSTAAKAGAPHGAATTPEVAPSRNTAGYDPAVSPAVHSSRRRGAETGITSSMARPKRSRRFPIVSRAQALELTVPNSEPVRPAMRPRIA